MHWMDLQISKMAQGIGIADLPRQRASKLWTTLRSDDMQARIVKRRPSLCDSCTLTCKQPATGQVVHCPKYTKRRAKNERG